MGLGRKDVEPALTTSATEKDYVKSRHRARCILQIRESSRLAEYGKSEKKKIKKIGYNMCKENYTILVFISGLFKNRNLLIIDVLLSAFVPPG